MTLTGHPFARRVRSVAFVLMTSCSIAALAPQAAVAQTPAPAPLPPGPTMTLDQAAPMTMPMPAPPGQGTIQRINVEGTQRIEPDSVLSYLLLRPGQPYDP